MSFDIDVVPSAARWVFSTMPCVATLCSSTADATESIDSEISPMVVRISEIASTASLVAERMESICCPISPVALAV